MKVLQFPVGGRRRLLTAEERAAIDAAFDAVIAEAEAAEAAHVANATFIAFIKARWTAAIGQVTEVSDGRQRRGDDE